MAREPHIVITGGAGFVGGNLAVALAARHPDWRVTALDNLHRPGSELNLTRLRAAGVDVVRADVRNQTDLEAVERVDHLIECSADPSVLAGVDGSTEYVVQTNLVGAHRCLELARRDEAQMILLSTSRVYPIRALESLVLEETDTRYELADDQPVPGASRNGIAETFPLEGSRTLYGATKLAAELLISEYAEGFGIRTTVNRCGVIAGPWQMGTVDQGVFTHWVLSHHLGRPLRYLGYGGLGKQVRDLLHVDDLVDLLDEQIATPERWAGMTVNVGGGRETSLSLAETTAICRELTGRDIDIAPAGDDVRKGDVPLYLSDCGRLFGMTEWRPRRSAHAILTDIHAWILEHDSVLEETLGIAR